MSRLDSILSSMHALPPARRGSADVQQSDAGRTSQPDSRRSSGLISRRCPDCRPEWGCWLEKDNSGFSVGSQCGVVRGQVPSDDTEYRCFADEAEANQKKERVDDSVVRAAEAAEKLEIAGHAKAEQRLRQCAVWLKFLTAANAAPGQLGLSRDEAQTFLLGLRAACVQWGKEAEGAEDGAAVDANLGSPVLWAIAMALHMVARRDQGFTVPSLAMVHAFSIKGLHERLAAFKSQAVIADEKVGNATLANGAGREGARLADDRTRRKARFDSLGSAEAIRRKLQCLHMLLVRSGWEDGRGLSKPVRQGCDPLVSEVLAKRHVGDPCATLIELKPAVKGLGALAKPKSTPAPSRPATPCTAAAESEPESDAETELVPEEPPEPDDDDDDDDDDAMLDEELWAEEEGVHPLEPGQAEETRVARAAVPSSVPQAGGGVRAVTAEERAFLETCDGALGADQPKPTGASQKRKRPLLTEAELKRASFMTLIRSRNYEHDPKGAMARWRVLTAEFAEEEEGRAERARQKAQAERRKAEEKARMEAARAAKRQREEERKALDQEGRVLQAELANGAEREKRQRIGGFVAQPAVAPTAAQVEAGGVKIKIESHIAPIRIPAQALAAAAAVQEWAKCDVCGSWRELETAWPTFMPFLCMNVGERCARKFRR